MSFDRVRAPGAWLDNGVLLPEELDAFDTNLSNAIDGAGGGAYAPSAPIVIGGAGVQLDVPCTFDELAGGFVNTAALQATSSTLHDAAVDGDFSADDATFTGDVSFTSAGSVDFAHGFTVSGGTVDFNRPVTIEAATTFSLHATTTIDGAVTLESELVLSGVGRIRERVSYATDTDMTVNPALVGQSLVWVSSGAITAPRTITFLDGQEGQRIRLVNYSAHAMTLHNSSGGSLLTAPTLPAIDGDNKPGVVELEWLTNGATTVWSYVGA